MRFLLAIVILAGLGWSGWWYWHASMRERAIADWLAERRADGWLAEAGEVTATGFPNRIDIIVTDLALADPEAGWTWRAEEFQVLSLSYRPNEIIAVWPGTQVIGTPVETVRVSSGLMRGSVTFAPNSRLTLQRATVEIADMVLAGDSGWEASVAEAIVATRQAGPEAPPFAHDIALTATDLVLPGSWTDRLERTEVLPGAIGAAKLDTMVVFDRDWDRPAIESENPEVEAVEIRDMSLTWGRLDLRGRGDLVADANGRAEGEIELRARNWREMLEIAEASGALPGGVAGAVRGGLDLIAMLGGDSTSLNVPLNFEDGRTRLGPVVVGDAPRLSRAR